MFRVLLANGDYESAQEYGLMLELARKEFEEECIIDQILYEQMLQEET